MDMTYFNSPETGEFRARLRAKSYADVERVIEKHKGKNDVAVDKIVAIYLESLQWEWLDEYNQWETDYAEVEAYNSDVAGTVSHTNTIRHYDEATDTVTYEEVEVLYEVKPLPVEPVRPPLISVEDWKASDSVYKESLKLRGVEIFGVVCSATAKDQWGLGSIKDWIKSGGSTNFHFENGSVLNLNSGNIDAFDAVWIPFRAGFF